MADLEAVRFVESYKLERFITDGLNSGKFGYDAVEILSEIYVLERYDVAPVVHGRWKKNRNEKTCSECHFIYYSNNDEWNYCPNCGAKMDGER